MREADLTSTKIFVRFGPEESEPVLEKAGREKRRKKQAVRIRRIRTDINQHANTQVRRMEQIIRSHNANEEGESNGMQTLDRDRDSEVGPESRRGEELGRSRRQHKRSILKQEGRSKSNNNDASNLPSESNVRSKGGNKEAKVKFAGSLQRRGGHSRERSGRRMVVRGPAYLLQVPWGYQPVHGHHHQQHLYELQLHQPRL